MKIIKKLIYIPAVLVIILAFSKCQKNFEDINTNPNFPTVTNPNYLFTYILKEGGGEYDMFLVNNKHMTRWIMFTASSFGNSVLPPYSEMTQYRIKNLWESLYTKLVLNTNELIRITEFDADLTDEENQINKNKNSLARIWRVFIYHKMTDLWGNIPYTDTNTTGVILKPVYDKQEDIYANMLDELKEAVNAIDENALGFTGDADILFSGDIDKWIKFANSLRLRLAIRSANEDIVTELMTENNFISENSENADFHYVNTMADWSPWYEQFLNSQIQLGQVSELLVTNLRDLNDPRLSVYAQPTVNNPDTIIGMPNLLSVEETIAFWLLGEDNTSKPGLALIDEPETPNQLLTYAEVCFLKAEAATRGWGASSSQQFYEDGIRASMEYYGIADSDIITYLAGDAAFDGTLEQLITQKWIALYLNGYEAFAEYRRTGYPVLQKWDMVLDNITIIDTTLVNVDPATVPGRIPYPDNEPEFNLVNYNAAVTQQGPDNLYTKVWWATLNHNF